MRATLLPLTLALAITSMSASAADSRIASSAINAIGVDLYRLQAKGEDNLLISPYSIQSALAMTFAGTDGDTRAEMQRVLHYPQDDSTVHESFKSFAAELEALKKRSEQHAREMKQYGGVTTPIQFNVANRLFAQRGYPIRPGFLALTKEKYSAAVEEMDFAKAAEPARVAINRWVETETKDRIRELISPGMLTAANRLVLVNALYMNAPWENQFQERATRKERFLVRGRDAADVPMMIDQSHLGYAKRDGYQVVTRRYEGGSLQMVIVLPDEPAGLAKVEQAITSAILAECIRLDWREVILHLPKFRIEPPTVPLAANLQALGMKTAFDIPSGSANFDRMAPRTPQEYLYIGAVLHKTFIAVDEKGTEAAAATAVLMAPGAAAPVDKPKPVEVRVDHPFLFAIQHVPSGACLFLGRVTDPR